MMPSESGKPEDELQFMTLPEAPLPSGVTQQYSVGGATPGIVSKDQDAFAYYTATRHPVAAAFHYAFKIVALFFYIFGGFFSKNFVFICVVCILLLAFDFWTVKNVTGRLLVGLRWWNNVRDDGSNEWVFESAEDPSQIHPADKRLFWIGLYCTPAMWLVLLLVCLLKFNVQWLIIVAVALVLSSANIIGYYKCSNDQKKKMRNLVENTAFRTALGFGSSAIQSFLSTALGGRGEPMNQRQPVSGYEPSAV